MLPTGKRSPSAIRSVGPRVSITEAEFLDIRVDLPGSEGAAQPAGPCDLRGLGRAALQTQVFHCLGLCHRLGLPACHDDLGNHLSSR